MAQFNKRRNEIMKNIIIGIILFITGVLTLPSCHKAYDNDPKIEIVIKGFQQSSYTEHGFFDNSDVFHTVVDPDKKDTTIDGETYNIQYFIEFGMIDLRYDVRNIGIFNVHEYEIEFDVLLEDGTTISVYDWGSNIKGYNSAFEQVYIDTKGKRCVEIRATNFNVK